MGSGDREAEDLLRDYYKKKAAILAKGGPAARGLWSRARQRRAEGALPSVLVAVACLCLLCSAVAFGGEGAGALGLGQAQVLAEAMAYSVPAYVVDLGGAFRGRP